MKRGPNAAVDWLLGGADSAYNDAFDLRIVSISIEILFVFRRNSRATG